MRAKPGIFLFEPNFICNMTANKKRGSAPRFWFFMWFLFKIGVVEEFEGQPVGMLGFKDDDLVVARF